MLTLGALVGESELELAFATGIPAAFYEDAQVCGVITLSLEHLLDGEPQKDLEPGSLVLITGMPFRIRGRIAAAIETLLEQIALDKCIGLIAAPASATHQSFPQTIHDLSQAYRVPLLVTTAPQQRWEGTHLRLQKSRLNAAEQQAARLDALIRMLPAQFTDHRAMQRVADWLSQALNAQVLISQPNRTLAASPATAAESLASAVIRKTLETNSPDRPAGPHTQMFSLAPSWGSDAVLAAARPAPAFSEGDVRLLRHAAKLLGLLEQARREYRAAAAASDAAKGAALELLLDGEVDKARRVIAAQAPGLLEADTARVYVVDTPPAARDAAARRCEAMVASRALVAVDPGDARRFLVIHPNHMGRGDDGVPAELKRLIAALGSGASLGGSGVYSITLLANALNEAITAQRFAVHQPDSIAMSARADLVTLLPPLEAQRWARSLLDPLIRSSSQWEQMRRLLPDALAYPYEIAARKQQLHRNTVSRRVSRAADKLAMDFNTVADRIAVGLAMELITRYAAPEDSAADGSSPTLCSLLSTPQVRAWADTLLSSVHGARRDLLTTATTWLMHNLHLEPTARALSLSVTTIRSHLQDLESRIDRDLALLSSQRDLQVALHSLTGEPAITDIAPIAATDSTAAPRGGRKGTCCRG
ncbi:helix-turn-helix domain-containing protein [Streptomyces spectabilis]|uniref:helix-turn-helix domain-containing protein n=1 Tax=Streptomyces spectabilis TaxID=68270 RepID=UPI0033C60577